MESKILVFRSARLKQIDKILDDLKKKHADCRITILCQQEAVKNFQNDSRIEEILVYGDGPFNLFRFDRNLLAKIKQTCFDLIVIPHNNDIGKGYFHVESIASLCKAKRIICYDPFLFSHSLSFGFHMWRMINIALNPFLKLLFLAYLKFQIWKLNRNICQKNGKVL